MLQGHSFRCYGSLLLLFWMTCAGCQKSSNSTGPAQASGSPPAQTAATTLPAGEVDQQLEDFAVSIADSVAARSPSTISDNLAWSALMERIAAGVDAPAKAKNEFLTGMQKDNHAFDRQLLQSLEGGGDFTLLRLRKKGDEIRALYRVILPNSGGINYFEMLLIRDEQGQPAIGDIFIYATGEDLSQNLRRFFLAALQQENRGLLERLTGKENTIIKHMADIQRLSAAAQEGDGAAALAIYRQLPEELQNDKMCLALRLRAAQSVNDEEYAAAIDAMRRHFGRDPSLNLLLIDAYVLQKKFDRAIECVDGLDAAVGGDPYLDCTRANLYLENDDLASAKHTAEKAIQALPNYSDGYLVALVVALREQRFDDALQHMEKLQETFSFEFEPETNPLFAEFRNSPQFDTWARMQRKRQESQQQAEVEDESEL